MNHGEKIWTVSELNRLVKEVLEQTFYPFRLRGEVSNLTIHRSGHVYFTLKDSRSQVSAVFFRGAVEARRLGLKEGMALEVRGRLSVYEPRGTYQIIVDRLNPLGEGDLQAKFEELKAKLRAEGLFDESRKRPIPKFPKCVGVVTSTQGAAIQDFCQILGRRFADMHVRIYPAAVQGEKAAAEIEAGLRFFNRKQCCDVIVVTRGGGSLEDLWPFNEERVARAIAAIDIPVVSAVGHEVDYTISDFAADLRVPTPSSAAELVVGEKSQLRERVGGLAARLQRSMRVRMQELRRRQERAADHYVFRELRTRVPLHVQRIDELTARMRRTAASGIERSKSRLEAFRQRLKALDPTRILARGYAVLTGPRGVVLKSSAQVMRGDPVAAVLSEGRLELTVEKKST